MISAAKSAARETAPWKLEPSLVCEHCRAETGEPEPSPQHPAHRRPRDLSSANRNSFRQPRTAKENTHRHSLELFDLKRRISTVISTVVVSSAQPAQIIRRSETMCNCMATLEFSWER